MNDKVQLFTDKVEDLIAECVIWQFGLTLEVLYEGDTGKQRDGATTDRIKQLKQELLDMYKERN